MRTGIRYFSFSSLFLVGLCALTFAAFPEGNLGIDYAALVLTYGVILAILGGVVGGVGLIRRADGEMDWGETVAPAPAAAAELIGSARTVS